MSPTSSEAHAGNVRRPPSGLLALGGRSFPNSVELAGERYELARPFKHDFFAATALYEGAAGRVVVKFGRQAPFLLLPMQWVGRLLAAHEAGAYRRLDDLAAVPRFVGMIGCDAIAHEFVDGHPLRKGERVPDDFFGRLREALETIHARDMAYVDLEKCENVLVGADGRPYLVDFQICGYWPWKHGGHLGPIRWLLRRLQEGDRYHLQKLQRRTRPDQLNQEELAKAYRVPFYVRLHRLVTRPLQLVRRHILELLDPRQRVRRHERGRIDD